MFHVKRGFSESILQTISFWYVLSLIFWWCYISQWFLGLMDLFLGKYGAIFYSERRLSSDMPKLDYRTATIPSQWDIIIIKLDFLLTLASLQLEYVFKKLYILDICYKTDSIENMPTHFLFSVKEGTFKYCTDSKWRHITLSTSTSPLV